jgi:hypothetical protein
MNRDDLLALLRDVRTHCRPANWQDFDEAFLKASLLELETWRRVDEVLDGVPAPGGEEIDVAKLKAEIALQDRKRREALNALNMVRRAVEELGVGLVQFDETVGPEAHHEAEAIIAGIHKLHDRLAGGC